MVCKEDGDRIKNDYIRDVDTVMCTKELCPCPLEFKEVWEQVSDIDLKLSNRVTNVDKMSQEEKDAYAKDGIKAKVLPLFFTDEGVTYKNYSKCLEDKRDEIKIARGSSYFVAPG